MICIDYYQRLTIYENQYIRGGLSSPNCNSFWRHLYQWWSVSCNGWDCAVSEGASEPIPKPSEIRSEDKKRKNKLSSRVSLRDKSLRRSQNLPVDVCSTENLIYSVFVISYLVHVYRPYYVHAVDIWKTMYVRSNCLSVDAFLSLWAMSGRNFWLIFASCRWSIVFFPPLSLEKLGAKG